MGDASSNHEDLRNARSAVEITHLLGPPMRKSRLRGSPVPCGSQCALAGIVPDPGHVSSETWGCRKGRSKARELLERANRSIESECSETPFSAEYQSKTSNMRT